MRNLFKKKERKFSDQIFIQKAWIEKQIEDAIHNRYIEHVCKLSAVKEQTEEK